MKTYVTFSLYIYLAFKTSVNLFLYLMFIFLEKGTCICLVLKAYWDVHNEI